MAKKKPLGAASTAMATAEEELRGEKKKKIPKSGKSRRVPLGPNRPKTKKVKQKKVSEQKIEKEGKSTDEKPHNLALSEHSSPADLRKFFLGQFESVNGIKLSSLELGSIKGLSLSFSLSLSLSHTHTHTPPCPQRESERERGRHTQTFAACFNQLIETDNGLEHTLK